MVATRGALACVSFPGSGSMKATVWFRPLLAMLVFCTAGIWAQSQPQTGPQLESQGPPSISSHEPGTIGIPGPLRSLERMAGISQKVSPDEVLPFLARNIYVHGYVGWQDR